MHCCLYYRHSGISQELSKDLSANSVVVGRHSTTLEVALSFPPNLCLQSFALSFIHRLVGFSILTHLNCSHFSFQICLVIIIGVTNDGIKKLLEVSDQ